MATKQARIEVVVGRGGFQAGLKGMEQDAKVSGKRMGQKLSGAFGAGLGNVKKTLAGMGSSLLGHLKTAATMGGAIGLGALAKNAIDAEVSYIQLAEALSSFTGEMWDAAKVQKIVGDVAEKTNIPLGDLRIQLAQLSAVAGKADIAELLERAASQARRLGMEGDFIGRVYTRMIAKGVANTAEEAEVLTEQFNRLFRTMLGVDLDEAIDPMDVAELSAVINTTGNDAAEMLKLISMSGDKVAKDFGKANEIVEELGLSLKQSKGVDEMRKKLKLKKGEIDANNTALENMLLIAEKGPKKFDKMANALSGDMAGAALKTMIGEEFLIKAKVGKVSKEEWDLRVDKLRAELGDLESLTVDRQRIEATDAKLKDTSSAKITEALNKITMAFSQPEMLKAINDLAGVLPELAENMGILLKMIVDHPVLAAGGYVGGRAALSFAGGAAGNLGKKLFAKDGPVARGAKSMFSGVGKWFKEQHPLKELDKNAGSLATKFGVAAVAAYGLGKAIEYATEETAKEFDEITKVDLKAEVLKQKITQAETPEEEIAARKAYAKQLRTTKKSVRGGVNDLEWYEQVVSYYGSLGGGKTVQAAAEEKASELERREREQYKALIKLTEAMNTAADDISKAGGKVGEDATRGPSKPSNKNKPGATPATE